MKPSSSSDIMTQVSSIENCYHCGIDFITQGDECICDTWVCQKCLTELVESEIMNQLSYNVSSKKFNKNDFVFSSNIQSALLDTIQLLRNT